MSYDEDDFVRTHVRSEHPATSYAAAEQARELAEAHRALLTARLKSYPHGETSEELGDAVGLTLTQVMKRIYEIENNGFAHPDGKRKNRSGRYARVWWYGPAPKQPQESVEDLMA